MRRRIREAIVGVSAIILIALGVPLAIVVRTATLDSEVVELQASAARALAEIDLPLDPKELAGFAEETGTAEKVAVYGPDGRLIYGDGPTHPDATVRQALRGRPASNRSGPIVVATPILKSGSERVRGVLRVTESLNGADRRARAAWAVMGAAAVAALGLAWLMGTRLARALSEPLSDLAESARSIGEAGVLERREPSGVEEIDALADVLDHRARAVHEALLRERRFSSDASHQLRTPITALRLKLEELPDTPTSAAAIQDLRRVELTIDHLLAMARDAIPAAGPLRVDEVVAEAIDRWRPRAHDAGRDVVVSASTPATVDAHRTSIDEILDVLVDNALRHGTGTVTIGVRHLRHGVAVDLGDEGEGLSLLDADRIFARGFTRSNGDGNGIGLAVARSLAEADGGRLQLISTRPTTFSLLYVDGAEATAADRG